MKVLKLIMLVLVVAVALGKAVNMLPPETYREPIFVGNDQSDDGDDSGPREYTVFA